MTSFFSPWLSRVVASFALIAAVACADTPTSEDSSQLAAGEGQDAGNPDVGINGDTPCVGTLSGTFDNVHVPVGKTCTLRNSVVHGNVRALDNSTLFANHNTVGGNIDGIKARIVQVRGGTIEGSIQIKDANSPSSLGASVSGGTVLTQGNIQIQSMNTGGILIADVVLRKGNIKVEDNLTRTRFEIVRNQVAQNLQVFTNRGSNRKVVQNNTVSQIVQCKSNTSPFVGGPNTAGDAQDQCF